jgi:hypothetical protein
MLTEVRAHPVGHSSCRTTREASLGLAGRDGRSRLADTASTWATITCSYVIGLEHALVRMQLR